MVNFNGSYWHNNHKNELLVHWMIIVVVEKKQWSPPTDILPDIPIYYELYINLAFYLTYKKLTFSLACVRVQACSTEGARDRLRGRAPVPGKRKRTRKKRRKATESDGKRGGEGVVHLLKSRDPHVAGGEKWNLHYPVWKKGCSGDLTPGTAVMKVQSIYLFPQFQRPG